ncbi:MAG: NADH-quinone oxidoreductase subunit J [Anaerolineae bacterium]|nr:NADH-quinone oxidoreductase subunit J [Anaerolineae bacterium]
MTQLVLFVIFGAITLAAAIAVVTARNLFHAVLWLLLAFFGVAGLYVLLEAPFFAAAQLFIYMGAIGVLIIYALMLTRGVMRQQVPLVNDQWALVAVLAVALLAVLSWLFLQHTWPTVDQAVGPDSLRTLGEALVDPGRYGFPFEVASVLLVMALIGAVTIVRER